MNESFDRENFFKEAARNYKKVLKNQNPEAKKSALKPFLDLIGKYYDIDDETGEVDLLKDKEEVLEKYNSLLKEHENNLGSNYQHIQDFKTDVLEII